MQAESLNLLTMHSSQSTLSYDQSSIGGTRVLIRSTAADIEDHQ